MMKRTFLFICLILGSQSVGCTSLPNGQEEQARYVYCNVYAASVCFGIAGGDVMTMHVPADFVTYELVLMHGAKLFIYSGYNPPQISGEGRRFNKEFTVPSGRYEYVLTSNERQIINYAPNDNAYPSLQIEAEKLDVSQSKVFSEFLRAFRPCKSSGAGVLCEKEQPIFNGVAEEVYSP